jgi:type IV pilus assembly protein PilE
MRGVTLIELMVVLAVVAILGTIAYPSYTQHIRTSNRAEAQAALMGLAAAMERHFAVKGAYTGAAKDSADTGTPAIFSGGVPLDVADEKKWNYVLTIEEARDSSFKIMAAPSGKQAGDDCGKLTLTQAFERAVEGQKTGLTAQDCWKK